MPVTPHIEKHFTSSETVRDLVIGMSDGLTAHAATVHCAGVARRVGGKMKTIIKPGNSLGWKGNRISGSTGRLVLTKNRVHGLTDS
jgi:hypothetical protein